jgi:hypothetical protein
MLAIAVTMIESERAFEVVATFTNGQCIVD